MSFETIKENTKQILCDFCGETNADLAITGSVDCNGVPFGEHYCTRCYFGYNPHIKSLPVNLYRNPKEEGSTCKDCNERGKYKLEFHSDKEVIYFCEKHFCPGSPCITLE